MTNGLSGEEREQLAKILSMLGSNHAGERAAAGLKAQRLVNRAGLTWSDVLAAPQQPSYREARTDPTTGWRATVDMCLRQAEFLSDWEFRFLTSVSCRASLTQRQQDVLDRIAEKVRQVAHA